MRTLMKFLAAAIVAVVVVFGGSPARAESPAIFEVPRVPGAAPTWALQTGPAVQPQVSTPATPAWTAKAAAPTLNEVSVEGSFLCGLQTGGLAIRCWNTNGTWSTIAGPPGVTLESLALGGGFIAALETGRHVLWVWIPGTGPGSGWGIEANAPGVTYAVDAKGDELCIATKEPGAPGNITIDCHVPGAGPGPVSFNPVTGASSSAARVVMTDFSVTVMVTSPYYYSYTRDRSTGLEISRPPGIPDISLQSGAAGAQICWVDVYVDIGVVRTTYYTPWCWEPGGSGDTLEYDYTTTPWAIGFHVDPLTGLPALWGSTQATRNGPWSVPAELTPL